MIVNCKNILVSLFRRKGKKKPFDSKSRSFLTVASYYRKTFFFFSIFTLGKSRNFYEKCLSSFSLIRLLKYDKQRDGFRFYT